MCLIIDNDQEDPQEEKIFWKLVDKKTRTTYWFHTKYEKGETVRARGEPERIPWGKEEKIEGGAIHVWTSEEAGNLPALNSECLIRVRCQPKHFIAWGVNHQACYSQVEVLD